MIGCSACRKFLAPFSICASCAVRKKGQQWREHMSELVQSEGSTALRKAKLTRSFNKGYQNYAAPITLAAPRAQNAINRFIAEGATIADTLVRSVP